MCGTALVRCNVQLPTSSPTSVVDADIFSGSDVLCVVSRHPCLLGVTEGVLPVAFVINDASHARPAMFN